jgi:hypothetical protein
MMLLRVRASSASHASRYVSLPNRSQISFTRYRHDVGLGLARGAGVVAEEAQDLLVEFAAVVELDRRHPDALLEDGAGVDGDGPGGRAAHVHQVAPLQRVADVVILVEDGTYEQDVREMRRAPLHHVRIVEGYDIAVFELFEGVGRVL